MTDRPSDIQAIIFDMGRVLVDIDNTFLVETFFKGLDSDDLQELGRRTMSDPVMIEFNTGRMPPEEFHRRMCDTYDLDFDYDSFTAQWCNIFFPMEGMEELVGRLARRVRIGLLSDTDPIHWNHIKTTWPWIACIANPTLSYDVGVMKPAPDIYLAAAKNVNVPPPQCLFIDDLQTNVNGAVAVGMQGIRFVSVDALTRELQAMNLLQPR